MAGVKYSNTLVKYIFKVLYVVRKKMDGFALNYRLLEYKYLFANRIEFPEKCYFPTLPEFTFDGSNSKLVMYNNVASRGNLSILFYNDSAVEIGENTFFNNNCSLNALINIKIGRDCLFGENVKIYDHNHKYKTQGRPIKDQGYITAPVVIGNNCWLGSNVIVLKGVTIGDNSIIGAKCIIHKSIPANSIVINPAENKITTYA